ncbi:CHAP domain-containing protein [Thermomonospora echinospora]|uniref:CHAP domain-containing protein n=1 Tax=Thermomonospora echinospora TaxID=1992 RepID=A0A1H5S5L3_9ACTN|nr:CHAP domain-containing protein [Thermomonospora echinospora]SEF45634.1 CHAP domain-containing protein [Thermomonospora echinospora]
MAGKRRLKRVNRFNRITNHPGLTCLSRLSLTGLRSGFSSRQGAVASALVAGAVATSALTVAAQVPAQAAVGAAAPITALGKTSRVTESLTGVSPQSVGQAQAQTTLALGAPPAKAVRTVSAEDVIRVAESQVGTTEDDLGKSKFGRWYASTQRAKETLERDEGGYDTSVYEGAAWCAMFLAWAAQQAGTDALGADPYTVTYAQSFKDQGRWGTQPKPGAIVFFDWSGGDTIGGIDHVGMVTEVLDDGTVKTVEGNISDSVVSKIRSSNIVGYGYPDYAE